MNDAPLRLEWRSPQELAENPANWRRHPINQLNALTDVIADVGWAGACLYNERTKRLIDGHARRKVALEQGTDRVPVLVGNWTEEQEAKILATLDPLAAMAEADGAALAALLKSVESDSEAVNAMLKELSDANPMPLPEAGAGGDEFDPTPDNGPTRTHVGDVWVIGGKHRLLVGDNTIAENVERLMDGQRVRLCFTSPPYAQQRDYGEAVKEKVQDWYALMCGTFSHLPMTDDGQVLVNLGLIHRDGEWVPYWDEWIEWMRAQGWRRFGWYVWDQGYGLPGDWHGRLAPSFEFVFHFNRQSIQPTKNTAKKPENIKKCGGTQRRSDDNSLLERKHSPLSGLYKSKIPDNVFRCFRQQSRDETGGHPAPFSVEFATEALAVWPGDVYDPFMGSWTTGLAAHRLGHTSYGCELEPKYADVCLRRAEAEGLTVEKDT